MKERATMKSIKTKIMLLVIVGLVVASSIVFVANSIITTDILYNSAADQVKLLCEANSSKFNSMLDMVEESVAAHANMVIAKLGRIELIREEGEERDTYLQEIKAIGHNHVHTIEGTLSVFVSFDQSLTKDNEPFGFFLHRGRVDQDFADTPLNDVRGTTAKENPWWFLAKESVDGSGVWVQSYFNANVNVHMISYVKPIYKDGIFIGVAGMDLSFDMFGDQAEDIVVYDTGFAAVLNPEGYVVYHPRYDPGVYIVDENPKFTEILGYINEDTHITPLIAYRVNGLDYHMCLCALNNGMLMYVSAPDTEVFAEQDKLWNTIIVTLIITVLITLVFAQFFANKITLPVKELTESARRMIDGNLDTVIVPTTKDEIGELSVNFDEMRKKLKLRMDLLSDESRRDGLTSVGNKTALNIAENEIDAAIGEGNCKFCVVFFDVNRLKVTNDVFGHMAGDDLIRTVSLHLCESFGDECVYRVGGDEFVVVLRGEELPGEEEILAKVATMEEKSLKQYPEVTVSCAVGIAFFDPERDKRFKDTFDRADRNMYLDKSESKKRSNPWMENEKGIKRIRIEKFYEILSVLSQSTEDYPYLLDFENRRLRFFGNADEKFDLSLDDDGSFSVENFLCIVHPADRAVVSKDIEALINGDIPGHNMNYRWINRSGNTVWFNCRGKVLTDDNGNPFVMIGRASQATLKHLFNPSTGLFNKTKFMADIKSGEIGSFCSLMLVCIDNLSSININKGRAFGDALIRKLGESLEDMFGAKNLYHMEKDRFVILLDTDNDAQLVEIFEGIKEKLGDTLSVSAAVVGSNTAYVDKENIYDHAKQLIKDNRSSGMGNLYFFTKEQLLSRLSTAGLIGEIEKSVKSGCEGFYLCYQPKISARKYAVTSAEALLRYKSKERGNVFPDQFIPLLERTGMINEVGLWVLDTALAQCKKWREKRPDFSVSVNFSAVQLRRPEIAELVISTLEKHGLPGDALTVELTESVQLDKSANYEEIFDILRSKGVKISIDDFGTGYSNLSYLRKIHADEIKIDRFFISDIKEDSYNYKVVSNIVEFAKKNEFSVCLEGVETPSELAVLEGLDIDLLQGYLFDRPVDAEIFAEKYVDGDEKNEEGWVFFGELHKHRSDIQLFKFDTKDIISQIGIGLWVIKLENGVGEMFTDAKMRELLGVADGINARDCYDAWRRGIPERSLSSVDMMVESMANDAKVMHVEYVWVHPTRGEVTVRFTGKCVRKTEDGIMIFEGFHKIISDMGESFGK